MLKILGTCSTLARPRGSRSSAEDDPERKSHALCRTGCLPSRQQIDLAIACAPTPPPSQSVLARFELVRRGLRAAQPQQGARARAIERLAYCTDLHSLPRSCSCENKSDQLTNGGNDASGHSSRCYYILTACKRLPAKTGKTIELNALDACLQAS